jgi:hypothetical protein
MSGRSRLFVSAESITGRYNAVTLRAYLGGDAVVKEGEHAVWPFRRYWAIDPPLTTSQGKYGFIIDTASPDAIRVCSPESTPLAATEHKTGENRVSETHSCAPRA